MKINPYYTLLNELKKELAKAPQSRYFTKDAVVNWVKSVFKYDIEKALWHAKRVSGIGGSEIGPIVRHYMELDASAKQLNFATQEFGFASVQEIYNSKILKDPITIPTPDMLRGIINEPAARSAFLRHAQSKGWNVEIDEEAKAAFSTFKDPLMPWLRYSEDDVFLIDGKRVLLDYKCPDESPLTHHLNFDYKAQLNHGALLLERAGLNVDALMLVKYNVMDQSVLTIDVDNDLGDIIRKAGDHFWTHHVLTNTPVPYKPREAPQLSKKQLIAMLKGEGDATDATSVYENLVDTLRENALQYGQLAMLQKALTAKMASYEDTIVALQKDISTATDNAAYSHEVGATNITTKKKIVLNDDEIIARAQEAGLDLTEFSTTKYDTKKILAALEQTCPEDKLHGLYETDYAHSVRMSRKTTGPTGEIVSALRDASVELAEDLNAVFSSVVSADIDILSQQELYAQNSEQFEGVTRHRWESAVSKLNDDKDNEALENDEENDLLPLSPP